jgi:hypothetical protein
MCEELMTLELEAVHVFREVKKIRRSRDVSFCEDTELNREKRNSINAIIKHLLVGHEGKPCPGGDRPIVSLAKTAQLRGWRRWLALILFDFAGHLAPGARQAFW